MNKDQQEAAREVAERWRDWILDPEHNPPPNPKASVEKLREWKRHDRTRRRQEQLKLGLM